jgi:hypothetical protein
MNDQFHFKKTIPTNNTNTLTEADKWYFRLIPKSKSDIECLTYIYNRDYFLSQNNLNYVIIAKDCIKADKIGCYKQYNYIKMENYNTYMNSLKSNDKCLYEVIHNDNKVKLYLDIDIKKDENNIKNKYEARQLIKNIIKLFEDELNKYIDNPKFKWNVYKSHSDNKYSYHILLIGYYFENSKIIKDFIESEIKPNCNEDILNVLDVSVYRANGYGLFRLPGSRKKSLTSKSNPQLQKDKKFEQPDKYYFYEMFIQYIDDNYTKINYQAKPKPKTTNIIKPLKLTNVNSNSKIEENIDKDEIIQLLNHLDKDRCNNYNDWFNVISTINVCLGKDGYELAKQWSKNSNKYDDNTFDGYWNNPNTNNDIYTLRNMVKKDDNPFYSKTYESAEMDNFIIPNDNKQPPTKLKKDYNDIINNAVNKLFNNNSNIFKQFDDNVKYDEYNEQYVKPLDTNADVIFLKSPLGTGKSYQIREYLKQPENTTKSVLYLSARILYGFNLYSELINTNLGFTLYKDIINKNEWLNQKRFICSIESLRHLNNKQYDIVILDEIETLICNLNSNILTDKIHTCNVFASIINKAKNVIITDAFLDKSKYIIQSILGNSFYNKYIIYYNNTFKPKQCKVNMFRYHKNLKKSLFFDNLIYQFLDNNKKICFVCSDKSIINDMQTKLKKRNYNVLTYTSDTDDQRKKNELTNINKYWSNIDIVIYNSSITCGVNFDIDNQFDNLFIYSSSICSLVRDVFQSSKRVRHFKDNTIYACLNDTPYYTSIQNNYDNLYDDITNTILFDNYYIKQHFQQKYPLWYSLLKLFVIKERHDSIFNHLDEFKRYAEFVNWKLDWKDYNKKIDVKKLKYTVDTKQHFKTPDDYSKYYEDFYHLLLDKINSFESTKRFKNIVKYNHICNKLNLDFNYDKRYYTFNDDKLNSIFYQDILNKAINHNYYYNHILHAYHLYTSIKNNDFKIIEDYIKDNNISHLDNLELTKKFNVILQIKNICEITNIDEFILDYDNRQKIFKHMNDSNNDLLYYQNLYDLFKIQNNNNKFNETKLVYLVKKIFNDVFLFDFKTSQETIKINDVKKRVCIYTANPPFYFRNV